MDFSYLFVFLIHYPATICNISSSSGLEIYNQKEKRPRLLPTGLLVASDMQGSALRKRKDN